MANHVRMFQPRFHEAVRTGKKVQTIRPEPKRPIKKGDRLSLRGWSGLPYRSQQFELVAATVSYVGPMFIGRDFCISGPCPISTDHDRDQFAQADGFENYQEMLAWFEQTHALPFEGVLIKWIPDTPPAKSAISN